MATPSPVKSGGTPPSLEQRLSRIGTQSLVMALVTLVLFTSVLVGYGLHRMLHGNMNEMAQGLSRDGLAARALADPAQRHELAELMRVAPGIRNGWLLDDRGRIVVVHPADGRLFEPAWYQIAVSTEIRATDGERGGQLVLVGGGAPLATLILLFFSGSLLIAGIALSYTTRRTRKLSRLLLDPVTRINTGLLDLAAGRETGPIQLTDRASQETRKLAESFNSLRERLTAQQDALEQERAERHRVEKTLEELAHRDAVTGLANRHSMTHELQDVVAGKIGAGQQTALLVIDLDNFKHVNDTQGHDAGDRLLREVGARLKSAVRDTDMVARMGGDEFAIMAPGLSDQAQAGRIAEKCLNELRDAFANRPSTQFVSASIGVSLFPRDASDLEGWLNAADKAMYAAKTGGKNTWRHFQQKGSGISYQRKRMLEALRGVLAHDDPALHLNYQPVFRQGANHAQSLEILARWQDEMLGQVSPRDFLTLADQSGLGGELVDHLVRAALTQTVRWRDKGLYPAVLSVNVTTYQMLQPGFCERLQELMTRFHLPPPTLQIEFTASTLNELGASALPLLEKFRKAGVRLCLDDFGGEDASLLDLLGHPFHEIKLARDVVKAVPENRAMASLVRLTLEAGRLADFNVIAKGVDKPAQLAWLDEQGCRYYQGFLFARPEPAPQVEKFLSHSPGPAR